MPSQSHLPDTIDPGYAISMLASGRIDLFCVNNRHRGEMRNKWPDFEKFNRMIYDDWPLVSKKEALKKTKKLIRKFKTPQR